MKRWLWIVVGILGLAQFIQPDRSVHQTNMADHLTSLEAPSPVVAAALRAACYDCHSNETQYPWYAHVTPVNWWLQESHVDHGRHHFNVNEWGTYGAEDRAKVAEEAVEMLKKNEMPLASYTWLHPEAELPDTTRQQLIVFFDAMSRGPE